MCFSFPAFPFDIITVFVCHVHCCFPLVLCLTLFTSTSSGIFVLFSFLPARSFQVFATSPAGGGGTTVCFFYCVFQYIYTFSFFFCFLSIRLLCFCFLFVCFLSFLYLIECVCRACRIQYSDNTGVPGGLVGGPRAYHRVHARKAFFLRRKLISGKRESVN